LGFVPVGEDDGRAVAGDIGLVVDDIGLGLSQGEERAQDVGEAG
jgi:hypothetical protein